jgi:hypothetical protein
LLGFSILALAMPLPGQIAGGQTTAPCPVTPAQIQRQAYTAELKTTSVQKLADGTTITSETKEVRARDSQGRTLNTNSRFAFGEAQPGGTWTMVNDPVERTQSNWDSQTRKARVMKLPPADQQEGCWADEAGNFRMSFGKPSTRIPAPVGAGSGAGGIGTAASVSSVRIPRSTPQKPDQEDLGTATIMGIEAHGYRMTFTTPVGEVGNDRPMVRTSERWAAPGFDFALRQVESDPRTGTRTTELVSLDRSEPDPATFQPPEGYEITIEELHEVACNRP